MHYKSLVLAAIGLAAPLPAAAQIETIDPDSAIDQAESPVDLAQKLADPAVQAQTTSMVAVLSDVLLDLPLAPLAKTLTDAGVEAADRVPADTTLRKLAPDATHVQDEVTAKLPQMMGAMAAMAKGMEAMMPALRDMAAQAKRALPAK